MNIEWKNINDKEILIINSWLSSQDKHNLCMTQKSWKQTAEDIGDCLKHMNNAQFRNIIGYINKRAVVALMFGIEQIEALNLYNIVVNPRFRNLGVAKAVVTKLLNNDKSLKITQAYKKVIVSTLPDNVQIHHALKTLNFDSLGFDGEYVVFEKSVEKTDEKTL